MPGVQIKFAPGNSWIVATGRSGTVFGAEDAQVQQQVQRVLAIHCREKCRPGASGWGESSD